VQSRQNARVRRAFLADLPIDVLIGTLVGQRERAGDENRGGDGYCFRDL
jgi:hypothetical protein